MGNDTKAQLRRNESRTIKIDRKLEIRRPSSEAWVVADPEIVEIFTAGVAFGVEMGRRGTGDPAYSPDEWRKALREAMEKAATLEDQLEKAKEAMLKKK